MNDDGTIATRFTFRADGFDGKQKEYNPRGFVRDTESNAVWGMQFIWPFEAEYRVVYLKEDYSQTVIGPQQARLRLDHGAHAEYRRGGVCAPCVALLADEGYDVSLIERVPQNGDAMPRVMIQKGTGARRISRARRNEQSSCRKCQTVKK